MRVEPNEFDEGRTVICVAGDDLANVPRSHRKLITPTIRQVFANPKKHFQELATKCQFPKMAEWLRAVTEEDRWELQLIRGRGEGFAGFYWYSNSVRDAAVALARGFDLRLFPPEMQHYYSLVDVVDPMGYGCAGQLRGADNVYPFYFPLEESPDIPVDLSRTHVWGDSPCGDILFITEDGRGGWFLMGPNEFHVIGTISETIDAVYSQMLMKKAPNYQGR
jgi:hypothetical protein